LSVTIYKTSTSPANEEVACCTSDELDTVRSEIDKLVPSAAASTASICATEFASPALYITPTFAPSKYSSINCTVFSIASGCRSTTPVILSPGSSIDSTKPASTASVTDVNNIGISLVAFN